MNWVRFDDHDLLVGDDFFGGVKDVKAVGVFHGFDVGEELESLGLESLGEFLEHFRDLWGF